MKGSNGRSWRFTHQTLGHRKAGGPVVVGVIIVEFIEDGVNEDRLFVDCEHRVCWHSHPVVCMVELADF
jgi:hypothetical protein